MKSKLKTPISYYGGKQKLPNEIISVIPEHNLLIILSELKGKFHLSSYPSPLLQNYAKLHGWHMWSVEQRVSVNQKGGYQTRKKLRCLQRITH